jgi:hypothetical protein
MAAREQGTDENPLVVRLVLVSQYFVNPERSIYFLRVSLAHFILVLKVRIRRLSELSVNNTTITTSFPTQEAIRRRLRSTACLRYKVVAL